MQQRGTATVNAHSQPDALENRGATVATQRVEVGPVLAIRGRR